MRGIVASAVADFARTMSVDNLELPDDGDAICFAFDAAGQFFIEYDDAGLYLYLVREIAEYDVASKAVTAFQFCHYKNSQRYDTQMAVKDGNQMIILAYLTQDQVTGPEIEAILQHLVQLHDRVQG